MKEYALSKELDEDRHKELMEAVNSLSKLVDDVNDGVKSVGADMRRIEWKQEGDRVGFSLTLPSFSPC